MPANVLDASAVAKLFRDEPESATFRSWMRSRLDAGDEFFSPSLVQFELGEIIRDKESGTPAERAEILRRVIARLRLSDEALGEAFRYVDALSFYDAAYVALAKHLEATLVTYDRRIRDRAQGLKFRVASPGR